MKFLPSHFRLYVMLICVSRFLHHFLICILQACSFCYFFIITLLYVHEIFVCESIKSVAPILTFVPDIQFRVFWNFSFYHV
jgi:hypothetical protein